MIHAVVDTNVLASGAVASKGPIATITDALFARQFGLTLSIYILVELKRTLEKPYFAERLTKADRGRYLRLIAASASNIVPTDLTFPPTASQPKDDPILQTTGGIADYLVTGDGPLLKLGVFKSTQIVTAAEFAALLVGKGGEDV